MESTLSSGEGFCYLCGRDYSAMRGATCENCLPIVVQLREAEKSAKFMGHTISKKRLDLEFEGEWEICEYHKAPFPFGCFISGVVRERDERRKQCQSCGTMLQGSLCPVCLYVSVLTVYGPIHIPLEEAISSALALHEEAT